ncbi:hypothetical protein [Micromonospora chersina]|uniref:hypothetical protein n=1 Tax=Micromonospora chersina TaxID=47854 RepID=UPI0033E60E36
MANERRTSRSRKWNSWSGDVKSLEILGKVVLQVIEERRVELLGNLRRAREEAESAVPVEIMAMAREADRLTTEIEAAKVPEDPEDQRRALNTLQRNMEVRAAFQNPHYFEYQRRSHAVDRLSKLDVRECVEVTVFDRYEEIFGNLHDVLAELDRRSTQGVVIRSDGMRPPIRSIAPSWTGSKMAYISD